MKHFAFICLSFSGSNYFLPVHRQCQWNPASIPRITAIFVGECERGGGSNLNYSALPGRERNKYWFNSHTVTTTDSPFYGKRFNSTEKRGLTPNIVLCTHLIHAPWPTLTHHSTARDLIQQRKRAYTKYCTVYTHRANAVFQCRKTRLKGWLKQEYLNAINGL